jgi:cation:H+ antiporter
LSYLYILAGIILLLFGGDWLVKASVDIALRAKISLLVVGLTVVSFATSAPELLVSLNAAFAGHIDISFGNVIGSNLANLGLILGVTALVFPLTVKPKTIRVDYWIMLGATALLLLLLLDGKLGFWDALLLTAGLVAYNILQIRSSRRSHVPEDVQGAKLLSIWLMLAYLLGGIAALRFGAQFLVEGSVQIAKLWGVSDRVIGVSIVSVGTSLPELAASLIAAFKGEQDISLGNLIGSNVFNILAVLGFTGLVVDLPVESSSLLKYDFPCLIGVTLLLLPFIRYLGAGNISRWQGFTMLLAYTLYLVGVFIK